MRGLANASTVHLVTRSLDRVGMKDFAFLTAVVVTCPGVIPASWEGGSCFDKARTWMKWLASDGKDSRARDALTELRCRNWLHIGELIDDAAPVSPIAAVDEDGRRRSPSPSSRRY